MADGLTIQDRMIDPDSVTNIHGITPEIGCVMTGILRNLDGGV